MRIIDGSGTHIFINRISSNINSYNNEKRTIRYKSISQIESESTIGTNKFITFKFKGMTLTEKNLLNTIFIDNDITKIDNFDEVLSGENYTQLLAATDGFFINNRTFKSKQSIDTKDIEFFNATLTIRFDTNSIIAKP